MIVHRLHAANLVVLAQGDEADDQDGVTDIVYPGRGDEVSMAAVDGRIIYENGCLKGLEEDDTLLQIQNLTNRLGQKAAFDFWKINGTNAQFMKKGRL